jgi:coenzyme F420-reducing hydrogenase beta subunit
MNAKALSCCTRFWYFFKLAAIGFAIGVLLYFMVGLCDYRCTWCGEKAWGKPFQYTYYEQVGTFKEHRVAKVRDVCSRCYSELTMWDKKVAAAERHNMIIAVATDKERQEYMQTGKVSERVEELLRRTK